MNEIKIDPFDLVRAEAMLLGYDSRWGADRYEVLAVEQEFRAPLINPDSGRPSLTWSLGGKLDVLVRDPGDRTLMIEHKTTSSDADPGSDYVKRLRLDGQISIYYAGAEALGQPVQGCLYDVLVKPGQRPLKATPPEKRKYTGEGKLYANQREEDETPEAYRDRLIDVIAADPNSFYMRAEVVRLEEEMSGAMLDVWQLAKAIRENELKERYPRNPGSCVRWGRTCQFFGVCTGEDSLDDLTLFRKSGQANEELSNPEDASIVTASRLGDFQACARLHHLKYRLGYRPAVEAEVLRFGTMIHRGLAAWWRADPNRRLEEALSAITEEVTHASSS